MNGEWIFTILFALVPALVSVFVGYFLGTRSQRKQDLREYITDIVKEKYPQLFAEIKRNSERLDNYLENPFDSFGFSQLEQIYNKGLDGFVKKHHNDLFLLVDFYYRQIRPKLKEFHNFNRDSRKRLRYIWEVYLRKSLPREAVDTTKGISESLLTTINPYNVMSLLLNERDEETKNKIEACILERTAHIYREKAKRPYVIEGQQTTIDYDGISQSLIEKAKPEVAKLIEMYKELKEQNDTEVKKKLLPLLQKYISKPV